MAEENPFARLFEKQESISVRLAALEPGKSNEPIKLRIINADPRDIRYECISYDRSKHFESENVEVDGQSLAVSKPLVEALSAFRIEDSPRHLWADLLIGSTIEERSTQAREMKSVFEHADKVTAWLGISDPQQETALEMMVDIANKWEQARLEHNIPENYTRATLQQNAAGQAYMAARLSQVQPSNKPLWNAVQDLICTTYFETTQSISEIVLAKKADFTIGSKSISWHHFKAATTAFIMLFPALGMAPDPRLFDSLQRIMRLETATRRKRDGESLELFPMMKDARRTSYRDPREIVYSMLPIATPCTRTKDDPRRPALPTPDYSKSVVEVFKQASKYIIEDRQDVMMWWYERPPCGRRVTGLPSWAIDWSTPIPDEGGPILEPNNGLRAWADPLNNKRIYIDEADGLHLQAHALDRIEMVSPIFTHDNCRNLCLTEWQRLCSRTGESSQDRMDRFFRTLILNIAGLGETFRTTATPSAEIKHSFQSLLAEERILQVSGLSGEELVAQTPEFIAQLKAKPEIRALTVPPGHSQPFDNLLRTNTIGRRFFQCQSGRFGMTAIETPPLREEGATPVPNFDQALGDPLAQSMMSSFQSFLAQRDPQIANALAAGLSGKLPGQQLPAVRTGDIVVAVVGGYQPYILRPAREQRAHQGPSAAPGAPSGSKDFFEYGNVNSTREEEAKELNDSTKYNFVGDCYLHGVMDGECFKETAADGTQHFRRDIKTVDVTIV